MREHISSVKSESREFLLNKYYSFLPLLLFLFVLEMLAGFIPASVFTGSDALSGIFMTATSFILNVLFGLAGVGLIKAALNSIRGEAFTVRTLFYAFSNRSNRFIIIQLIFTAIKTAFSTPEILLNRYIQNHGMSFFMFYGILSAIMIGSLFLTMLVTLRLIWANYFLLDDYDLNAGDALKMSLAFTRGRTLEILYMKLSFVGMFFLSYVSLMIGFVYVRPYSEVTYANYYLKYKE